MFCAPRLLYACKGFKTLAPALSVFAVRLQGQRYFVHLRYLRPETPRERAIVVHRLTLCAQVMP